MTGKLSILAVAVSVMVSLVSPATAAPEGQGGGTVDLALHLRGPSSTPLRGDVFDVVMRVSNVGGTTASNVSVSGYMSDALEPVGAVTSDPGLVCTMGDAEGSTCSMPSLAAGSSATATFTLKRVAEREAWIDSWVASAEADTNYDDNYGWLSFAPDRSNPTDVSVRLSAPTEPEIGSEFVYTSVVNNHGPNRASSVVMTQSLSEHVSFVSVSSSDPSDSCALHEETYGEEGAEETGDVYRHRQVRCALGPLAVGERATVTVTVVRDGPHALWSDAWVQTATLDENYENDYSDSFTPGHPSITSDLSVSVRRSADLPLLGDDFEYTFDVFNAGPVAADDVILQSWIPQELAVRSVTTSRGTDTCQQDRYQSLTCTLAPLAAGEGATFTLAVTRVRAREIWMDVSLMDSNYDPTYEDRYVGDHIPADRSNPADVAVTLDAPIEPEVGSTFDYRATVVNNGPSDATGVTLISGVPEGTEFVGASSSDEDDSCVLFEESYEEEAPRKGETSGGESGRSSPTEPAPSPYIYREVRCDLGTMAPGGSAVITITVKRLSEYEIWNSVWVSTASYDGNYRNDSDNISSTGERFRDSCGDEPMTSEDGFSEGVVVDCDVQGGASKDAIEYELSESAGSPTIRLGAGDDELTMRIPTSSEGHREVLVKGGRGKDKITILVAPGAGNVTLMLRGGRGRDSISVVAPRPGRNLSVRMRGGPGIDTCEREVGDRYIKRPC